MYNIKKDIISRLALLVYCILPLKLTFKFFLSVLHNMHTISYAC